MSDFSLIIGTRWLWLLSLTGGFLMYWMLDLVRKARPVVVHGHKLVTLSTIGCGFEFLALDNEEMRGVGFRHSKRNASQVPRSPLLTLLCAGYSVKLKKIEKKCIYYLYIFKILQ